MLSVWSFFSYVVLPIAMVMLVLLLSGVQKLEKFGDSLCNVKLKIGQLEIRLPLFFLFFALLYFANEQWALSRLHTTKDLYRTHNIEAWRSQLWRHQRNW